MKLARVASITSVLLEEGLGFLTHRPEEPVGAAPDGEGVAESPEGMDASEVGRRLRRTLEKLGPT
ncbi:MAG: hypothetical protein KDA28_08760, partial [Phycisphaerales bacterium]|nr:hypothetical protein [Phycisphaerales bacterium]